MKKKEKDAETKLVSTMPAFKKNTCNDPVKKMTPLVVVYLIDVFTLFRGLLARCLSKFPQFISKCLLFSFPNNLNTGTDLESTYYNVSILQVYIMSLTSTDSNGKVLLNFGS